MWMFLDYQDGEGRKELESSLLLWYKNYWNSRKPYKARSDVVRERLGFGADNSRNPPISES
jgi:hypothetical protein